MATPASGRPDFLGCNRIPREARTEYRNQDLPLSILALIDDEDFSPFFNPNALPRSLYQSLWVGLFPNPVGNLTGYQ